MPDKQGNIRGKTSQERSESQGDRPDHVPYAQRKKQENESDAPDVSEHSAGGQGLSG